MKNIMHITYSLNMGGLEKFVIRMIDYLDKEKYQGSICCLSDELALQAEIREKNIPLEICPKKPGLDFKLIPQLMKVFKKNKIDLIHTHNPAALLYGGIAAKLTGIPFVHTEHSNVHKDRKNLMRVEKMVLRLADKIICDTYEVQREMHNLHKVKDDRVCVIHNGIDYEPYGKKVDRSAIRKSIGLTDDDFVVGAVGRLTPIKDQKTIIQAIAKVNVGASGRSPVLIFVGDGEIRQELEDLTDSLGVRSKVSFLGMRNNVPELLQAMDVFMLCSLYEGMSLALLEAMAAYKPVIATYVGGNPEVIVQDHTGFLVEVGAVDEIANTITKMMNDPALVLSMGKKSRQRIEEHFGLDYMMTNYEKAYTETLNKNL